MKDRIVSIVAALMAMWMVMPHSARAQQVNPNEMGGMLLMADGKRMRGFLQNSNENGLLFSLIEGAPGKGYSWEQVKAVALDESNDLMRNPRAAFAAGEMEIAAKLFGKVADTFVRFAYIPDSFASEARFYQIEALRLLGRYKEIGPLMATPTGVQVFQQLPEYFHSQHKLNVVWGRYGSGDLDGVKTAVDTYVQPQEGKAKMLPGPTFKKMPAHEMVQLTYLRAKVYEAAGEKKLALEDLYRTFTFTHANNTLLAKQAMQDAMAIQKEDPGLGDEKKKTALRQMQSLAYLFKNAMNSGEIDPAYAEFAVKPEVPKLPAPKPKEETKEAPAGDAKKEKPAEDGKAGDEKAKAGDKDKSKAGDKDKAGDKKKDDAKKPAPEKGGKEKKEEAKEDGGGKDKGKAKGKE